jgi:hypothetical protein
MAMNYPHPIEELSASQIAFIKETKRRFIAGEAFTQEQTVFNHLLQGKGLTGPQALKLYHLYRLSGRINELRHDLGFPVSDERLKSRLALYYFEPHHLNTLKKAWSQA